MRRRKLMQMLPRRAQNSRQQQGMKLEHENDETKVLDNIDDKLKPEIDDGQAHTDVEDVDKTSDDDTANDKLKRVPTEKRIVRR